MRKRWLLPASYGWESCCLQGNLENRSGCPARGAQSLQRASCLIWGSPANFGAAGADETSSASSSLSPLPGKRRKLPAWWRKKWEPASCHLMQGCAKRCGVLSWVFNSPPSQICWLDDEDRHCALSDRNTGWKTKLVGFWTVAWALLGLPMCHRVPSVWQYSQFWEKRPHGYALSAVFLAFSGPNSVYVLRVTLQLSISTACAGRHFCGVTSPCEIRFATRSCSPSIVLLASWALDINLMALPRSGSAGWCW